MRTKAHKGNFAVLVAATAFLSALAMLLGSRAALAAGIGAQTVLCSGDITHSTDSSVPTGPFFSIGNVAVNSANAHCAHTKTTVTQVTQGKCNGQTPCVTTTVQTNDVPIDKTGCSSTNNTPGITTSTITQSSNPKLVGCQVTSSASLFSGINGSFTLTLTPTCGSGCGAAGTGGITGCTSNAQ
jgi:hypothetical protein